MARCFYEKDGNLDFLNGRIAVSLEAKELRLSPPALTRAGRRGQASASQPEGAART
jgi:hypothetical protein